MARAAWNEQSDAGSVQAYMAERDISWVRLVIITFNVGLYVFYLPHDPARHLLAVIVSVVALLYAVFVVTVRPYRHFEILGTSAYTMVTDSLLIGLWLYATGGMASPFYPLWALSLVAVVFRFGPSIIALATGVYIAADLAMLAASGDIAPGTMPLVATRLMYIAIVGALGTLLGQRWRDAIQDRVSMAREVQQQEHALAEADRMRVLVDAPFEGICIHRGGRIVECNRPFLELFGREAQGMIGQDIRDWVDPSSLPTLQERLSHPRDDQYEIWIRRGDERRRIAVQARDIAFEGQPARLVALRDVTEEYEAQQARETARKQEEEIERLHEIDAFRTRFINTAAHELNTPMTPIKLQFAILRDQLQERPRAMELLERNLDRLSGLVQDMLDVARMQSGGVRMQRRDVDLVPALTEARDTFAANAAQRDLSLELLVPERLMAHTDPDRVLQILTNLLSNALKFTPGGGTVTVVGRDTRDAVRIEVVDTGPGLSPEQIQQLFQPFSQAHDDPSIPGTGLGLYICKTMAEALGGRVGVHSEGPGAGSLFWFELPRRDEERLDPPAAQPARRSRSAGSMS